MTVPPRAFRVLLVEDDPERERLLRSWLPPGVRVVVARSAGQALGILERDRGDVYGAILLDHDLTERTVTERDRSLSGSDVVGAVVAHVDRTVPVLVHSMNPREAPGMVERLERAGFDVTRRPMAQLTREWLVHWIGEVAGWAEEDGE